jgi:hypothetical protein
MDEEEDDHEKEIDFTMLELIYIMRSGRPSDLINLSLESNILK